MKLKNEIKSEVGTEEEEDARYDEYSGDYNDFDNQQGMSHDVHKCHLTNYPNDQLVESRTCW